MSLLTEHQKERDEEFGVKAGIEIMFGSWTAEEVDEWRNWLNTYDRKLIERMREMVEGMKHKNLSAMQTGSEFMTPRIYRALAHNQAIDDVLSKLM